MKAAASHSNPPRRLVVNADDFGLTPGVNRGIVSAFREGVLTSTTAMVNMRYFDEAVELARERLARTHFASAVTMAKLYDSVGAVEAGFLDEVVSEEDLLPRAIAKAEQLAELDMEAHKNTKARTRETFLAVLEDAVNKELG